MTCFKSLFIAGMATAVTLGVSLSIPGAAQAEILDVSVVENGVTVESWTQSSTPVVVISLNGSYTEVTTSIGTVTYYNSSKKGGVVTPIVGIEGVQMYTQSENDPLFTAGTYNGHDLHHGMPVGATVTFAAVPELATWAMMIVGLGGLGASMRCSRRKIALATA